MEDGDDVGARQDGGQLEGQLGRVGAGGQLAGLVRLEGGALQQLSPFPLIGRDAVVNAAGSASEFGGLRIDRAVGGFHDAPNPGELLCAALAACHDASMRMLADLLGVDLLDLSVEVTGTLDVRGTLELDRTVRVGFQQMTCTTRATVPAGTNPRLLERLEAHARRGCVNLRHPPARRPGGDVDPPRRGG